MLSKKSRQIVIRMSALTSVKSYIQVNPILLYRFFRKAFYGFTTLPKVVLIDKLDLLCYYRDKYGICGLSLL